MNKIVHIFTDGCCLGNPGRGGYGAILTYQQHRRELTGGFRLTTNNRMELLACIAGLEALTSECSVTITTDSQYVVNAIDKGWLDRWQGRGWRKSDNKPVENVDLWKRLLGLLEKHRVNFKWIRGHSGHQENERCDQLAKAAASREDLADDPGYAG